MSAKPPVHNSQEIADKGVKIVLVILVAALALWLGFNFIIKPNLPPSFLNQVTNSNTTNPASQTMTAIADSNDSNSIINNNQDRLPEIDYTDPTIILGGDVMLSRYVGRKAEQEKNYSLPWANIQAETKAADLALINLEAPFAETAPYFVADDSMIFKVDPQMLAGLLTAGIDGVSLENNHSLNQGQDDLQFTQELLASNKIAYSYDAPAWFTIRRGDQAIKIALLAYSYDHNLALDKLTTDLASVKSQGANYIIVSLHAGSEYTALPSTQQQEFAHAAIDGGANLVWGHHPHVVQPLEQYKNGYIFYSLGNLIFDQAWSDATTKGLMIKLIFSADTDFQLRQIELIPIKIEDNFQPRPMTPAEGQEILNILGVNDFTIRGETP